MKNCVLFVALGWLSLAAIGAERDEVRAWFRDNWFGTAPGRPADETFDDTGVSCAGGRIRIAITECLPGRASATNPVPVFVFGDHFSAATSAGHLAHYPNIPTNTITTRGYAYVTFNFNDLAPNDYASVEDEPKLLARNKVHVAYGSSCADGAKGTLAAWAWGYSRVMDWIESRPELDAKRVAIVGHSRGGKAALWAGAQDDRIALTIANDSGAGGARLMRERLPAAEQIADFRREGVGHWFADAFHAYAGREAALPYDAVDLLGLVAPRLVYVASASDDAWAGPLGEFAAVRKAAMARAHESERPFPYAAFPGAGGAVGWGAVGYHVRAGKHKLLPEDWVRFMDFVESHGWNLPNLPGRNLSAGLTWIDRRVVVLGDSISDPHIGWWKHWWKWVGEWLQCDMRVYAVNGRQWNDVPRQVDSMRSEMGDDVDAFLIFMGTNDFNSSVPLGRWWDENAENVNRNGRQVRVRHRVPSRDPKTLRGRINIALGKLKSEYPDRQIVLMTPIRRGYFTCGVTNVQPEDSYANELGLYIGDYASVVNEAGAIWSVPVIDTFAESGLLPTLPAFSDCCNRADTDRLHPGTEGCRRLALTVATKLRTLPSTFRSSPGQ